MDRVAPASIAGGPGLTASRAAAVATVSGVAAPRGGGGPQKAIRPSLWWCRIVSSGY